MKIIIVITNSFFQMFESHFSNVPIENFNKRLKENYLNLISLGHIYKKFKFDYKGLAMRGVVMVNGEKIIILPIYIVPKNSKEGENITWDEATKKRITKYGNIVMEEYGKGELKTTSIYE